MYPKLEQAAGSSVCQIVRDIVPKPQQWRIIQSAINGADAGDRTSRVRCNIGFSSLLPIPNSDVETKCVPHYLQYNVLHFYIQYTHPKLSHFSVKFQKITAVL